MREYELDEHHIRLLTSPQRRGTAASRPREALTQHGLTFTDRHGGVKPRSEVALERDSRIAFARLIRELDLRRRARPCPEEVVNMPRRRRFNKRRHPRRRELNDAEALDLLGWGAPAFSNEGDRRRAWEGHRDELMVRGNSVPGYRPAGFWAYEAPGSPAPPTS